jgi:hypothetical protein
MKILEMYLKVKYCKGNKENKLYVAIGTDNPRKLPKTGHPMQEKTAFTAIVTQLNYMVIKY